LTLPKYPSHSLSMLSFTGSRWTTAINLATESKPKTVGRLAGPFGMASMITPRLYLSGYRAAGNTENLQALGITHVISIVDFDPNIPNYIPSANKLHIRLFDLETEDLLTYLPSTTDFITQALAENESNKVLVHCMMGISRSATVVCAYIIVTEKMLASDAIEYVKKKREIICPNLGFRKQLEMYSEKYIVNKQLSRTSPGIMARILQLKETTVKTTIS